MRGIAKCINPACGLEYKGPRRLECPHCGHPTKAAQTKAAGGLAVVRKEAQEQRAAERAAKKRSDDDTHRNVLVTFPPGYEIPTNKPIQIVYAGAGEPRIRLRPEKDFPNEIEIAAFAEDNRAAYLNDGLFLRNEALIRLAQNAINSDLKYAPNGPEMTFIKAVINEVVPDVEITVS